MLGSPELLPNKKPNFAVGTIYLVHLLHAHSKLQWQQSPRELLVRSRASSRKNNDVRPIRKTAKRFRAQQIDRLVERYQATKNMRLVSREFGISRTTVAKHLADRGVDTSKSMKPTDIAKARELYAQGMGSGRIGKQLGFDNKTILKAIQTN